MPKAKRRPRIGVPWVASASEKVNKRRAFDRYLRAVREAGGEPVEISLSLSNDELNEMARSLDGLVLPGSASDIDTRRYNQPRHKKTAPPDRKRERVDDLLLDHAFAAHKPVLAVCYGAQILNVHQHGTLVQDIPSQLKIPKTHDQTDDEPISRHPVRLRGRLAELAGAPAVRVNSSHHQSILRPGRGLRVAARAKDGVVEGVEWIGGPEWIVGVQWHPERMRPGAGIARKPTPAKPPAHSKNGQIPDAGDALAGALFRKLIAEARAAESAAVSGPKSAAVSGPKSAAVSGPKSAAVSGSKNAAASGDRRGSKRGSGKSS